MAARQGGIAVRQWTIFWGHAQLWNTDQAIPGFFLTFFRAVEPGKKVFPGWKFQFFFCQNQGFSGLKTVFSRLGAMGGWDRAKISHFQGWDWISEIHYRASQCILACSECRTQPLFEKFSRLRRAERYFLSFSLSEYIVYVYQLAFNIATQSVSTKIRKHMAGWPSQWNSDSLVKVQILVYKHWK